MNIYGLTFEQLEDYFIKNGEKSFKAKQVYDWLYKKDISSFDEMTNIKKDLINKLKVDFTLDTPILVKKQKGKEVIKYLFQLKDLSRVEAVLMMHDYGTSLCISSEVGCNMNCSFCESGRRRKKRNLDVDEMVTQILCVQREEGLRISHVVIMGIGEPFDNYDNVMNFIRIINCDYGISIGARHITVSTCGVVPKIYEFADEKLQVNLAISLHAPNNELRNRLMPINRAYPLEKLIDACKYYIDKTNRRLTFEYILLNGVNDHEKEALELCDLIKGMNAYVNLIPYNETSHIEYKRSKNIMKFYDILKKHNINCTVRKEFGSEVSAACGQLRSEYEEAKK